MKDHVYHVSEPELAYKVGEPDDVAGLVSYLVKPESKFITGNYYHRIVSIPGLKCFLRAMYKHRWRPVF